jgi:hypothetical protein
LRTRLLQFRLLRNRRQLLVYALFLSPAASSKEAEYRDSEKNEEADW